MKQIFLNQRYKNFVCRIQATLFALLYSVWILPETTSIRNISLSIGALIGIFLAYENRNLILSKRLKVFWLMMLLFVWVLVHLHFFSWSYIEQLTELLKMWKYGFLATLMALGLSFTLVSSSDKASWKIIYLGLLMPPIIFMFKWLMALVSTKLVPIDIPLYLRIYDHSVPFYIPKNDYVAFCLPTFGVALFLIVNEIKAVHINTKKIILNVLVMGLVTFVFYAQKIKNGYLYESLLMVFALLLLLQSFRKILNPKRIVLILGIYVVVGLILGNHFLSNEQWRSFRADSKAALELDLNPQWKYSGHQGYPLNENGAVVSATNYERVAWGYVGLKLIAEHPLGYGLIENSFRGLVKLHWSDASDFLSHSHSGWIDLTLGIGIPGIAILMFALLSGLYEAWRSPSPQIQSLSGGLLAVLLLWFTTEAATNNNFECMLFWVVWISSLGGLTANHMKSQRKID